MRDRDPLSTSSAKAEQAALANVLSDFWVLARQYWRSEVRSRAWGLGLGAATLVHALLQLRLNLWLGDFVDALEARMGTAVWRDLAVFLLLALGLMTSAAAQIGFKMTIQAGWRRWITRYLIDRWLAHGHSYVLRFKDSEYDNPDYRIAEDVRLVTEASVDFAVGLINSVLLLTMFLAVLWSLSNVLQFSVGGLNIRIPGYFVLAAVAYAIITTTLTHMLGRTLVTVSGDLHAREGDLRYNLVRVRESAEGIAFLRGEADERRILDGIFGHLLASWRTLTGLQTRLAWLTTGFTVATPVVPLLIGAPQYLAGEITLGGLVQASQAFVQVQLALGFVVDNYARLSDWLAGIRRIVRLDAAITEIEGHAAAPGERHVIIQPTAEGVLRFVALNLDGPDGTVVIDNASAAIRCGEKVLIVGDSGIGKTTLFRAIAGLWPWGSGTIEVPEAQRIMFMPHRPYIPPGTLQAALAYPDPAERFTDEALQAALMRCGLGHYADKLATDARWHEAMPEGEQQRLAFARTLLHRPDLVLMDEGTSELDDAAEADMMSLFTKELAGTTLVSMGQRVSLPTFHDRTLTLTRSENGAHLMKGLHERSQPSTGRPWTVDLLARLLRRL